MPSEWREIVLEEVAEDVTVGHVGPMASEYVPSGIPFLRSQNIEPLRINDSDLKFINLTFHERLRKSALSPGDVVIVRTGKPGACAVIPNSLLVANCSDLVIVRCGPKLDARFLAYYVNSVAAHHVSSHLVGAVQQHFNVGSARKMVMLLPQLTEQRAIAHILGTLDDKIELNRRMIEALEAMARAIFKSWFVDFDPVRAKAEGRDPGLPEEIADLFPDRFEDTELGEIPLGWRIGTLGEVAIHPRRSVRPTKIDPTTPYIALEHMPRRCIALSEWGIADGLESNKFGFKRGEILFGKLRPYFHKVGIAPIDGVCSTDIVVLAPQKDTWRGFVLCHVSSTAFVEYTNAGSTGTKMPRTSWTEMARYSIVFPPDAVAESFTEQIRPGIERILALIQELRTLAALRDTLLPKLMTGEVRISDVERFMATDA
jgi:type I restriction enzyme S subunit